MRNLDITFPVQLVDIFLPYQSIEEKKAPGFKAVKKYKAVINAENGGIISIVSSNYELISNEEAIEMGINCFKQLFPLIKTDEIEIFNVITPSTKSFCHIDMVHKDYEINLWKKEIYLPYLRVTNSYNRTYSLGFTIGFCRKLCSNGVIFEKEAIKFRYYHTKNKLNKDITFDIKPGKLKELERKFIDYSANLRNIKIDNSYLMPLICKILNKRFNTTSSDEKIRQKEKQRFDTFENEVNGLLNKYSNNNSNAYQVFCALTDYGSNYEHDKRRILQVNSIQSKVGDWMETFPKILRHRDFSWDNYLTEFISESRN